MSNTTRTLRIRLTEWECRECRSVFGSGERIDQSARIKMPVCPLCRREGFEVQLTRGKVRLVQREGSVDK